IKRPSNSFILYRSAYADRARAWEKSPNHQKISSLAGESWAMEPPEIRKQYDAWAKVERENHAKAFPDYKFQPQ
ncbi:high mobility group box domain-containing protein, partial [Usnea florida]